MQGLVIQDLVVHELAISSSPNKIIHQSTHNLYTSYLCGVENDSQTPYLVCWILYKATEKLPILVLAVILIHE